MSGGGGSTTTQKADPWSGVQPGLMNLYNNAGTQFAAGGPSVYQGQGVQGMNVNQTDALANMANIANGGYGALNPAQQSGLSTTLAAAQGNDALSQQLQLMGYGGGQAGNALQGQINGTTPAEKALASSAAGTTPEMAALLAAAQGTNASGQYLKGVLSPNYTNVNNNPALQAAMDAANQNTTRNFTNAVMPGLASQFSAAGRFGSGAQSQGISDANNNLATQISGTNAQMANNAWSQLVNNQLSAAGVLGGQMSGAASSMAGLRNGAAGTLGGLQGNAAQAMASQQLNANSLLNSHQMTALGQLPGMALQGLSNANIGLGAGTAQQQQQQAELSDYINRFNANQTQPYNNLNWYANILAGGNPLASQTQTQSPQGSGLARVGGGALSGAATGAAIGSVFPGIGTAIGAGVGAIGGGLMGAL